MVPLRAPLKKACWWGLKKRLGWGFLTGLSGPKKLQPKRFFKPHQHAFFRGARRKLQLREPLKQALKFFLLQNFLTRFLHELRKNKHISFFFEKKIFDFFLKFKKKNFKFFFSFKKMFFRFKKKKFCIDVKNLARTPKGAKFQWKNQKNEVAEKSRKK